MNIEASVILPVYNDPDGLKITLSSLTVQDFCREAFEIIICDNNSGNETIKVAKKFLTRYTGIIKLVVEKKIQSSYAARNMGIENSTGDILAFIDADMTVGKDWLQKIVNFFISNKEIDCAGCNIKVKSNKRNIVSIYDELFGFPVKYYIKNKKFVPTASLVTRRSIFKKYGLFDEKLISCGDLEFCNRIVKNGVSLYFLPEIKMYHPARFKLIQILRKSFRIGKGYRQLYYYHPELNKNDSYNLNNFFKKVKNINNSKKENSKNKIADYNFFMKLTFIFITILKSIVLRIGYLSHYAFYSNNSTKL